MYYTMAYILTYIFGFIIFFGWMCYDELRNFVGDNKPELMLGLIASFSWPIFLFVIICEFIEDGFRRISARKSRDP